MKIKTENFIVEFDDSPEMAAKVFKRLIDWYKEHESFCGETIQQRDEPIIDAPNILSLIADDIIKFDVEYDDDED
ncbi:hypothetical protein KAR91_53100 [Candidatus Pacearchaeota archaeon]|nr:hypothetical protein [Candidatus Pacearchaeota archaeon]